MPNATVTDLWERLDAWLVSHADPAPFRLNPPATSQRIARVESALGLELPEALRESLDVHDGQAPGALPLFEPGALRSTESAGRRGPSSVTSSCTRARCSLSSPASMPAIQPATKTSR
jgi:cell wall assembly regulator SMI1